MVFERLGQSSCLLIRCVNCLPCSYECTMKYARKVYIPEGLIGQSYDKSI
jgi:hypothetical protein